MINNKKWIIVGASVAGKAHTQVTPTMPCQDSHCILQTENNWGIAVVCDGAGSAKNADLGSQFVAQHTAHIFADTIQKNNWHNGTQLPTEQVWTQYATQNLFEIYQKLNSYSIDNNININELACTVIVVIFSPAGLLVAHIGDGRAGFCNHQNEWLPILTPFKGEEANQTVFITSPIWKNPTDFLKTHVITQAPLAFTLLTDGCEAHTYKTGFFDEKTQQYVTTNTPYLPFFEPLVHTLKNMYQQNQYSILEINEKWCNFVTQGNPNLANEPDDKTLILGVLI